MESTLLLDSHARRLLDELQRDARLSYAELGRRVGLSPSATAERIERMHEAGLIRRFTIEVDPEALGIGVVAYIRMTCDGPRYKPFLTFIKGLSEVRECHHVTGADAFILQVETASKQELELLIERLLPYGTPTTSLVLSSPVTRKSYKFL